LAELSRAGPAGDVREDSHWLAEALAGKGLIPLAT
jgi:hypothetical protein